MIMHDCNKNIFVHKKRDFTWTYSLKRIQGGEEKKGED